MLMLLVRTSSLVRSRQRNLGCLKKNVVEILLAHVLFALTGKGSTFLFNVVSKVLRKDFNHSLRGKFVHGVVLVVSSWEVSEHVPGELIDALDDLNRQVKSQH